MGIKGANVGSRHEPPATTVLSSRAKGIDLLYPGEKEGLSADQFEWMVSCCPLPLNKILKRHREYIIDDTILFIIRPFPQIFEI